jgi:hypothetical protein
MNDKFCVSCKHYRIAREQPAGSEHRCNRAVFDLVTGKETKMDTICEMARINFGDCGPDGKYWEAMGSSEGLSKSDQRSG